MYNAKFECADGRTYSGAGQSLISIVEMTHTLPPDKKPVIIALYDKLGTGYYCINPDIPEAHNLFPGAYLQIGLQLPLMNEQELSRVGRGDCDAGIEEMARWYKSLRLPVFLRIGYEFDGEWNGYEKNAYKRAYRRIVDLFRRNDAGNVAFVWNSYTNDSMDMLDWYPDNPDTGEKDGDRYVDWFCYNTVVDNFDAGWFVRQADRHEKPVMVGESSYAIVKAGCSFQQWTRDFFRSLKTYGVKGYQYINWDWSVYPAAANWLDWKNGRYTAFEERKKEFIKHYSDDRYLFRDESYHEPAALLIHCGRALTEAGGRDVPWRRDFDHSSAKEGFGYSVENAVCVYCSGWNPGWRSTGSSLRLCFRLPEAREGTILLHLGCVDDAPSDYSVGIGSKTSFIRDVKGGHFKFPFEKSDCSKEGRLEVSIVNASAQKKVNMEQAGILEYHEQNLNTPQHLEWSADGGDGACFIWKPVYKECLYNIYINHRLTDVIEGCSYTITRYESHGVFGVSVYDKKMGEGKITEIVFGLK